MAFYSPEADVECHGDCDPDCAPEEAFFELDFVGFLIEDEEVEEEHGDNENEESEPGKNGMVWKHVFILH